MYSFDKVSIEMFFVHFGLFVEVICCMLDQFLVRHIDGKYRCGTTAPLV